MRAQAVLNAGAILSAHDGVVLTKMVLTAAPLERTVTP
jgi:hypothetical protein